MNKDRATESSWGGVAEWYDALLEGDSDTYQSKVILPNLMRVLDLRRGEKVIDIACGQGFFSRACKDAGASVTGADIAPELIQIAQTASPDIPFYIAPAHQLAFAKAGSFDTALIVLALQNIGELNEACAEAARVLSPTGRLVLVLNHPAFRILKHSGWGYDEKAKVQYRRIDRYLSGEKVKIDMHPGEKDRKQTLSYNRSLQDISKALRKQGFAITRLEEWISHKKSAQGPRAAAEDAARKEIPLFMMLEVQKLAS